MANTGFTDTRTDTTVVANPKPPKSISYVSGTGPTVTEETDADVLRFPRVEGPSLAPETLGKPIAQTAINANTRSHNGVTEPAPAYAPEYPFNHVQASESGHLIEVDDTPGAERVHVYHRTGSREEYRPDGSKVDKVVRDRYTVTVGDDYVLVEGDATIVVKGAATVKVDGAVRLEGETIELAGDTITFDAETIVLDAPTIRFGTYATLPSSVVPATVGMPVLRITQ